MGRLHLVDEEGGDQHAERCQDGDEGVAPALVAALGLWPRGRRGVGLRGVRRKRSLRLRRWCEGGRCDRVVLLDGLALIHRGAAFRAEPGALGHLRAASRAEHCSSARRVANTTVLYHFILPEDGSLARTGLPWALSGRHDLSDHGNCMSQAPRWYHLKVERSRGMTSSRAPPPP